MSLSIFKSPEAVDVIEDVRGGIRCCGCRLRNGDDYHAMTRNGFLAHVAEHQLHGAEVDEAGVQRIRAELAWCAANLPDGYDEWAPEVTDALRDEAIVYLPGPWRGSEPA